MTRLKVGVYKAKKTKTRRKQFSADVVRSKARKITKETDEKRIQAQKIVYEIRRERVVFTEQ